MKAMSQAISPTPRQASTHGSLLNQVPRHLERAGLVQACMQCSIKALPVHPRILIWAYAAGINALPCFRERSAAGFHVALFKRSVCPVVNAGLGVKRLSSFRKKHWHISGWSDIAPENQPILATRKDRL
jgi:hypothetical protein